MDTRRVDKRHLTHTNDTHFLLVAMRAAADVVEFVGNTKEVWTINLIHLSVWWNLQCLKVLTMQAQVVVVRWVQFVGKRLHRGGLIGTLNEEDNRQQ